MPNQQGGKNYKKSKHSTPAKPVLLKREEDQIYGRVIRNLGQRRMLVFSNDNKIRMCHIRGSMRRGSAWISIGDIVLITRRDFEKAPEKPGEYENADIIARYEKDLISELKKLPDINRKLFLQIETVDSKSLAEICTKKFDDIDTRDDSGIEFVADNEEEDDEEDDEEKKETRAGATWKGDRAKQLRAEVGNEVHERENEDFNIDDI